MCAITVDKLPPSLPEGCSIVPTVDGKYVAYSIGSAINGDTADIHFEKADKNYSGAFAAINKMFASCEFADTLFINREEDMGIEGLRRAKLSYHPVRLGEYYTAII